MGRASVRSVARMARAAVIAGAIGALFGLPSPGLAAVSEFGASMGLDPTAGTVGSQVVITGTGWLTDAGDVAIYFDVPRIQRDSVPVATAPTSDGEFQVPLTIPPGSFGAHSLHACQECQDADGPAEQAYADLFIQPALVIQPASGKAGDSVEVTGTGWSPSETVSIYWSQSDADAGIDPVLSNIQPDAQGFFDVKLNVPSRDPADYEVLGFSPAPPCTDDVGCPAAQPLTATAPFTLKGAPVAQQPEPTLGLSEVTGVVGQRITANGQGWDANAGPVSVFVARSSRPRAFGQPVATAAVSADGLVRAAFPIPVRRFGPHPVLACQRCGGGDSRRAQATFSVQPSAAPDRTSGRAGDQITVSGTGWDPGAGAVRVFFDQSDVAPGQGSAGPVGRQVPRSDGTFALTFRAPSDAAAGQHILLACQRCGADAALASTARFTLARLAVGPSRLLVAAVGLAALAVIAAGLWFGRLSLRLRWERKAEETERREPCDERGHKYCLGSDAEFDLRARRVTHVAIEVMQEALGPDRRKLEGAEVEALNRALLARRLHEAAEDLDQMAGDAANRIWRSFEAKLDDHTVAVSVSVHVEGGQASRGYTLYRCEPDDGKRSWKERANWTGKVKDERDYPVAVMRPVAGAWPSEPEMVDALQGRLLTVIGSIATDRHLSRLHASSETEIKL